jgi:isopenicillin N synthase-like dioxygenase
MSPPAIPVIDIAPVRAGDHGALRTVAAAIDRASREIGFFGVVGHGIPEAAFDACYDGALAFFDLPLEEKLRVKRPSPEESRGYNAVGAETLAYSLAATGLPDLKETFAIGPVDPVDARFSGAAAYPHYTPSVWPQRPVGLRPAWETYYRHARRLADEILAIFAIALDLPADWFADKTDNCYSMMRAQYYPGVDAAPEPGRLRAGAHTDYGALTVLRGDDAPGGLEVQRADGAWTGVTFPPGGYLVNLGDQLAMWSNDRWRSTLHRVVVPPTEALGTRRLSIGFFHMPNADAVIECLPNCSGPGNPPKYRPVTSGEHKRGKFARANRLTPVAGA